MRQVAALSLDGGGLLALSELYTIREVMQRLAYVLNLDSLPLPCEHFDVIGGSGSGGIIALLLGCLRMDVDQAIESFIQLYQALYGQLTQQESPEANWPSFSFAIDSILAYFLHNYDGLYRSESSDETAQYPLKTDKFVSAMRILIEMHLPDHGSEATLLETDSSCKTFVCAMPSMALTGRNSVKLFRNFRPRGNASFDCKIWEAALATTAHPRFCQPVKIGPLLTPQSYIDAGYGYNNPVKQVIEQTEAKFELSNSVYCFLSLGAGNPGVSGQSAQQRNSDWASLLEAIATDCERTAEQMDRSSKQGYVRINVEQGFQDIRLADWVDPGMVEAHTTNHLSQFAVGKVVDEVVDFLIERHHKVSGMLAMSRASVLAIERLLASIPRVTICDVKLDKTIVKHSNLCWFREGYVTVENQRKNVIVQTFYGPHGQENRNATLCAGVQFFDPGFLRPFLRSADNCLLDPFIIYDESFVPAERQLSAALTKSNTHSLVRQGITLISNLSSALEFLQMKAQHLQAVQLSTLPEDFVIFARTDGNFFIAFAPCPQGQEINANESCVNVNLLEKLCSKTVTTATLIYYRKKIDESFIYESLEEEEFVGTSKIVDNSGVTPTSESIDVLLDDFAVANHKDTLNSNDPSSVQPQLQPQLLSNLPKFAKTSTSTSPSLKAESDRRIFSWQNNPNKHLTLSEIAAQYSGFVEETQQPSLASRHIPDSSQLYQDGCPGYRRDEICLSLSLELSSIFIHDSPFPQEECNACGKIHQKQLDPTTLPIEPLSWSPSTPGMIVLSLDHGNVSGHSVLEILSEIMHRLNYDIEKSGLYPEWRRRNGRQCVRACDVFDVIAGSGTGGLVAGLLSALKMDDKDASNAYNDIAGFLFPSNTVQTEGPSTSMEIPNASNQSATKGLEAVLRAVVQANTESQQENYPLVSTDINGTGNGLILARSKVNAPIETQALFRTYQAPPSLVNANCALWQALRATTADLANGTLSTCTIGGREYWGTSIVGGNPTQTLAAELKQRFPGCPIDLVLSIGAGHPSTISLPPELDTTHVYDTLMKINNDCEATHDRMYQEFSRLSGNGWQDAGPYYRLSAKQGMQGMKKKSFNDFMPGTVATHTKMYVLMHETSRMIDQVVALLHKKMAHKEYMLVSGGITSLPRMPSAPELNPKDRDLIPLSERKRLLALDGGGLLGLSEMVLLAKVLNGEDKKPCEYFHLIAGSGTGGIFAVLLGRYELTIGQAMDAFNILMDPLEMLIQHGESDITKLTTVFEDSLEKMFSDQKMVVERGDKDRCKAFVLANALENINGKRSRCLGTYQGRGLWDTSVSIVEALRATTANRHLFEDVIVGKGYALERFGGTDYANNNPAELLIEEAQSLWHTNTHDPFVMSLGAGQVEVMTLPDDAPQPTRVFFPVLESISANCEQIHQHLQQRFKHSKHLYQRFNVEAGLEDKNLWSFAEIKAAVTSATRTYMLEPSTLSRMLVVGKALDNAINLLEEEDGKDSTMKKLLDVSCSAPTKIPVII